MPPNYDMKIFQKFKINDTLVLNLTIQSQNLGLKKI